MRLFYGVVSASVLHLAHRSGFVRVWSVVALPAAPTDTPFARSIYDATNNAIDRLWSLVLVPAVKSTVPPAHSDDHSLFICQPVIR